jgi:anti-anti-sigma factor
VAEGDGGGEQEFTAGALRVRIGDEDAPAVVALAGELDIASAGELGTALAALVGSGRDVAVDMSELQFCDSSGFTALLRARNLAGQHGSTLTLRRVSPTVARAMALAGLDKAFVVEQ